MNRFFADQDLDAAIDAALRRLGPGAGRARIEEEAWQWLQQGQREHGAQRKPTAARWLSASAVSAISRKPGTQRARLYDVMRKQVLHARDVDPDPALILHIRETSLLLPGHPASVLDDTAHTLAQLAEDTGLDTLYAPFLDLALEENARLLDRLPDVLGLHPALIPTIQVATQDNGWTDWLIQGVSLALASTTAGGRRGQVILSVNDCDRRAFGHRVHPDALVTHHEGHAHAAPAAHRDTETGWLQVSTADLPVHPFRSAGRPTDLQRLLRPGTDPGAIEQLLHTELLDSMHSGARKQLLLSWS
jgi:hypothetical protein